MAAVTVAAMTPEAVFNPAFGVNQIRANGLRHRRVGLVTVTTTGDTYASGVGNIVAVAWEAVNTSDDIAATFSGATVTFTGTNGSTGYLHIWSHD